ncbi:hypothetical protein BDA99DRAFT_554856 [Phascolomyces articulosus]|uniref:Uncharacterized protein n=1 Tax=Phascolomyces articulosus TaxID=60185 RepID=A0AAD5KPC9_9FUNG|nr:hypothetical protein BDA99DRAFT_554856 [Phascolomyces articulosus]
MVNVTLPFAETFSDASSTSTHPYIPIVLNDPLQFPALSPANVLHNEGWEMIFTEDDQDFCSCNDDSDDSVVWIDRRYTYVEIATKAGVHHQPIHLPTKHCINSPLNQSTHCIKNNLQQTSSTKQDNCQTTTLLQDRVSITTMTTESSKQLQHNVNNTYNNRHYDDLLLHKYALPPTALKEIQEQQEDPWYQCKHIMKGKHKTASINICRRKQKNIKIAFGHAAHNYLKLLSKQQKRGNPKQVLEHEERYLAAIKFLQINLAPRFYLKGDRRRITNTWYSGRLDNRFFSGRMDLNKFKNAFYNDPAVREVLLDLIHERLYSLMSRYWTRQMLNYYNCKERWPTWIQYIAYCYDEFIYSDLGLASYKREYTTIPSSRAVYEEAKRKWMTDLTNTLPSLKDKSSWRISRSQFAHNI